MISGYQTIGAERSDAELLAERAMQLGVRVGSIERYTGIHSPSNDFVEIFRVWLRTHSADRIRAKLRDILNDESYNSNPDDMVYVPVGCGFRRFTDDGRV